MNDYYIEYISKSQDPYLLKVSEKKLKMICKTIIKEGGEIVKVYYLKDMIYYYERIEVDYKRL